MYFNHFELNQFFSFTVSVCFCMLLLFKLNPLNVNLPERHLAVKVDNKARTAERRGGAT